MTLAEFGAPRRATDSRRDVQRPAASRRRQAVAVRVVREDLQLERQRALTRQTRTSQREEIQVSSLRQTVWHEGKSQRAFAHLQQEVTADCDYGCAGTSVDTCSDSCIPMKRVSSLCLLIVESNNCVV